MTTNAAARERAHRLFEQVKQGKIIFFKTADGWDIIGPADKICYAAIVTAERADGTTQQVVVKEVMSERVVDGIAVRTATFRRYVTPQEVAARNARRGYSNRVSADEQRAIDAGRELYGDAGATIWD